MPTSGARSGTQKAKYRPAGDGKVGPTALRCGCELHSPEEVARTQKGKRLFRCPEHGLVERR